MQPHLAAPHVVFGGPVPWRDTLIPPKPDGQRWCGTTLGELLAEPSPRSVAWLPAVYARLLVASTGAILVSGQGAGADRLERSRWLRCAQDSDYAAARRSAWPVLDDAARLGLGVGSLAPDLVIVAERDPYDRLPMFARSGIWLFRALRHLGYDELSVYVCNALDADSRSRASELAQLRDLFARYDPRWVSLGAIAHEALGLAGVEHVAVEHPSRARRFDFAKGPEGFAAKMRESGVPDGPWAGQSLPCSPGGGTLASQLGLPRSVAAPVEREKKRKPLPPELVEKVRTAFVLGQHATVREAAKAHDAKPSAANHLVQLAKEQGWESERDRYLATKRERVKSSTVEEEARSIAKSRGLAWKIVEKMLGKLDRELDGEDALVQAKDVKAMGDLSLSLSEKGDAAFDDERKRLQGLSPDDFKNELRKVLGETFGGQEIK